MQAKTLQEFIDLTERRKALENELDVIKRDLKVIEAEIKDKFARDGVNSVSMNGTTVYLQRQLWAGAKGGDYGLACSALRECGLEGFIQQRFNVQAVSAFVREEERNERQLPPALQEALEVAEVFSIRTRKF